MNHFDHNNLEKETIQNTKSNMINQLINLVVDQLQQETSKQSICSGVIDPILHYIKDKTKYIFYLLILMMILNFIIIMLNIYGYIKQ